MARGPDPKPNTKPHRGAGQPMGRLIRMAGPLCVRVRIKRHSEEPRARRAAVFMGLPAAARGGTGISNYSLMLPDMAATWASGTQRLPVSIAEAPWLEPPWLHRFWS